MKVIDPNIQEHLIKLIPRFEYVGGDVVMELYDESTQETSLDITDNNLISDGVFSFDFEFDNFPPIKLYEGAKYQLKLTIGGEVFYRGKIIATSQTPQDYKLTNGLYE